MGAEADDWPTLRFDETAAQEVKTSTNKQALYYITALFNTIGRDNMNILIQK